MPIGKVSVAGGGPMPPVPEQPADQGQVLAGHYSMAGRSVARIVKPQTAEPGIPAHRPLAGDVKLCMRLGPGHIWRAGRRLRAAEFPPQPIPECSRRGLIPSPSFP